MNDDRQMAKENTTKSHKLSKEYKYLSFSACYTYGALESGLILALQPSFI